MTTRTATTATATKPAAKAAAARPAARAAAPKKAAPVAAAAAEDAAEAAPEAGARPAEKKTRQQLTVVLNVDISQARCATHLKQNLGDEETEAEIKELRKELKAAQAAGDAQLAGATKAKIAELSKTLVRLSSEAPIAAAVVCDFAVKELLRYGMDQAIASDRKIVEVGHYHDGDPALMRCYPLINKLPTFAGYDPEHEEELRKVRAAANKAAKEAREAKKAAAEEKKGGKAAGRPAGRAPSAGPRAAEAEDDAEDDEPAEHTKTTFNTYVENALRTVKKDLPYSGMRVSNRVREDLADTVAELIAHLSDLSRIIVQTVMKVRTMNADHIKAVVHLLMANEGRTPAQVAEITDQVDAKLDLYRGHLRQEKEKKAAGLGAEKKAELENKRLEAELLRKQKQADLAKKRAIESAQKAKELTAESARLAPIVAANQAAAVAKTEAVAGSAPATAASSEMAETASIGAVNAVDDLLAAM